MVRAFVAVKISDEVRRKLVEVQGALAKAGAEQKLVEPENLHLTLKFLGEVQQEKIRRIVEKVSEAVAGTEPFDIHVAGIGAFPSIGYARVVWAGMAEGGEKVAEVQKKIDSALTSLGFSPERDFHPHITLSRVKFVREKARFVEFLKEMAKADFGVTRVDSVSLEQSTLTSKGPIYSTLAKVELQSLR
ncbi:MAG: RNA 2',3'-cyclic phosphodiesterase [Candidatus Hadarchaeales archaeon]